MEQKDQEVTKCSLCRMPALSEEKPYCQKHWKQIVITPNNAKGRALRRRRYVQRPGYLLKGTQYV